MPLSSCVQLARPGWIIFNTIEVESQSMAAAVTAKAASDILVRLFLSMLDAWGRLDAKILLRSDQEVTLSLNLREVQATRQHRTLVERSPDGEPRDHWRHGENKPNTGRGLAHTEARD